MNWNRCTHPEHPSLSEGTPFHINPIAEYSHCFVALSPLNLPNLSHFLFLSHRPAHKHTQISIIDNIYGT